MPNHLPPLRTSAFSVERSALSVSFAFNANRGIYTRVARPTGLGSALQRVCNAIARQVKAAQNQISKPWTPSVLFGVHGSAARGGGRTIPHRPLAGHSRPASTLALPQQAASWLTSSGRRHHSAVKPRCCRRTIASPLSRSGQTVIFPAFVVIRWAFSHMLSAGRGLMFNLCRSAAREVFA